MFSKGLFLALTIVFLRFSVRRFAPELSVKVNSLYTSTGVLYVIMRKKFANSIIYPYDGKFLT